MSFTFEKRYEKFDEVEACNIKIELLLDNNKEVGYRNKGYGIILVENSIEWLKINCCTNIVVSVAEGHESFFISIGSLNYIQE